jgi:hypothetical protein
MSAASNVPSEAPGSSETDRGSRNDTERQRSEEHEETAVNRPSGNLDLSARDVLKLEKAPLELPMALIATLAKKWRGVFNTALAAHKNIREVSAVLPATWFKNCYGVQWEPPRLTFDRVDRVFTLHSKPTTHQDILCFEPVYGHQWAACVHASTSKDVFIQFFDHINRVRWCSDCGDFTWAHNYQEKLEMCERCMLEEICASLKTETLKCTICQEDGKRMFRTHCGHHFHRRCLAKVKPDSLGPRCPLCRAYLDPADDAWHGNNPNDDDEDDLPD